MAMMISKFHKLIQSKVVWYIVLGVVVVAFVGFFTPMGGGNSRSSKEQFVGEIFGEKISNQEYRRALQNENLWYILSTGRQPDREEANAMEDQAWQRLAALHKAAEEGAIVSDQEVVLVIRQIPLFANQQGVFDKRAYDAILQQIGVSKTQVENMVREQIAIQKLISRPIQAALISPYELERAYHMYSDRLVMDYAVFPSDMLEPDVTVSREEAETFFNENKEAFRMPAQVRVSYVEFPVADFLDQAEIPEGAALQIYNQNLDAYRVETTGDVDMVEYKLFEEVEEEITASLAEYSARRLATEQATALVADIASKTQGAEPDFKGAAAEAGLTVKSLPAFAPGDELSEIDETAPFQQAAFALQDDIYSFFSDAVVGKDTVYVISLDQRYESSLPDFETVEKEALEAASARAAAEAGAERMIEIREAITAALKTGSDFKAAVEPYGVDVQTTEEFDLSSPPETDYAEMLIQMGINTDEGELCEMVPVEEGVFLAYVAQRNSLDPEIGLPALRGEIVNGLTRIRAQRLAADWQQQLMTEANLQVPSE